jgi:hypothetical protein
MCEICVACITCVFCTMCVCATKLLFCREKGIVLLLRSGMAQFGSTDQSRWNINCGVINMSSRSRSCRDVHSIRIPCLRVCSDMCCFFVRLVAVMCTVDVSLVLGFVMICAVKNLSHYEELTEY